MAVNPRSRHDPGELARVQGFQRHLRRAAQDILTVLDAASTTSTTITDERQGIWMRCCLSVIGFSRSGIDLLGAEQGQPVNAINRRSPRPSLLMKYNPELTCLLVGRKERPRPGLGGRDRRRQRQVGRSWTPPCCSATTPTSTRTICRSSAAKGGPGGKPGCGSLPDVAKNWPVR